LVVQALLSSQTFAVFTHVPVAVLQESVVHALLSSQLTGVFAHAPVAVSHVSTVQALLSLQFLAGPGTQTPPEQASFSVQALLSEHGSVLLVYMHAPFAVLHESVVQGLLSLHTIGVYTHPVAVLQESMVQALLSLQTMGV
jgi:hypothetical protein